MEKQKRIFRSDKEKARILRDYVSEEFTSQQIIERYGFGTRQAMYSCISEARKKGITPAEAESPREIKGQIPESVLREIGDKALELGHDVIRTPLIRGLGHSSYGQNKEDCQQVVEHLHALDGEKYGSLRYEPVEKRNGHNGGNSLSDEEQKVFREILGPVGTGADSSFMSVKELNAQIARRLQEIGSGRTNSSIRYHSVTWRTGQSQYYHEIPRKTIHVNHSDSLKREIEGRVDELTETHGKTLEGLVEHDRGGRKRDTYLRKAARGHQELLVYMLDPKNYQEIIGPDAELLTVDFDEESTDPDLYEKYKRQIEGLHPSEQDEEVVRFVDGNMRCDIVVRRRESGVYDVSEIKQFATNKINKDGTPGDQNATRASQQITRYQAVLLDNIRRLNRALSKDKKIPEEVIARLVAYEIDYWLQGHLQETGRRVAVVPRQNVTDYLAADVPIIGESVKVPVKARRPRKKQAVETNKDATARITYAFTQSQSTIPQANSLEMEEIQRQVDDIERVGWETEHNHKSARPTLDLLDAFFEGVPEGAANWAQPPIILYETQDGNVLVHKDNGRCKRAVRISDTNKLKPWILRDQIAVKRAKYSPVDTEGLAVVGELK